MSIETHRVEVAGHRVHAPVAALVLGLHDHDDPGRYFGLTATLETWLPIACRDGMVCLIQGRPELTERGRAVASALARHPRPGDH